MPARLKAAYEKKTYFDLGEYEQTIVNHTLSQPKFGVKDDLKFDTKKLNLAPKSSNIVMFD